MKFFSLLVMLLITQPSTYAADAEPELKFKFYVCEKDDTNCILNAAFSSSGACHKYQNIYEYDDCALKGKNDSTRICTRMARAFKGICK